MKLLVLLKDPAALKASLKAAVERRALKLAERLLALGHKTNPSGNNMSQR